jgi:post-segregation antitoxin (ccd killing protein)
MDAIGRTPAVGNVVVKIDDDLHARARALQVRKPGLTWAEWVEDAIAEAVERQEAERAEEERRRRSR